MRRHRGIRASASAPALARGAPLLAISGTLLCALSLLTKLVALYKTLQALEMLNLGTDKNLDILSRNAAATTPTLAHAGILLDIGSLMLLLGGACITFALNFSRFRKPWFFWSTATISLLIVWQPLTGTLFGVWWLWCLLWTRTEFSPQVQRIQAL